MVVMQPLELTEMAASVDVKVTVRGAGRRVRRARSVTA